MLGRLQSRGQVGAFWGKTSQRLPGVPGKMPCFALAQWPTSGVAGPRSSLSSAFCQVLRPAMISLNMDVPSTLKSTNVIIK